ncbi:MAG: hypothetical protein K2X36_00575 [Microbacteriaceae bacterium]|nr:hypothetical protein [Microbacteriaceae bacterium]
MFMGVGSHNNVRRVTSYSEAQAVLERCKKTPTGKRRTEKREGLALGLKSRGSPRSCGSRPAGAFQSY